MKKIYFLGECMVELKPQGQCTLHQSFAGDVYNSAVYLKRCFPQIDTSVMTVIGKDRLSCEMRSCFEREHLDCSMVYRHDTRSPGLYLIETDQQGERNFTYWRSQSAARTIVEFLSEKALSQLMEGDILFLSGISVAVVETESRKALWHRLKALKDKGVQIAFDPNYRARLWSNAQEAKSAFKKAFELADFILPGVEDLEVLYGLTSAEEVIHFLSDFNATEVVVKNGPSSVVTWHDNCLLTHSISPVENIVDTTSAGDAFNGTYMGARMATMSIDKSVTLAAKAAGIVIQHPGAIAPAKIFSQAMQLV